MKDPYNARVRALFADPAHAGTVNGGKRAALSEQDVRIEFYARLEAGSVDEMRFLAHGCPHVIAAAEAVCASLEGQPAESLKNFRAAEFMETLAVPTEKSARILVIEDAVRLLGAAFDEAN